MRADRDCLCYKGLGGLRIYTPLWTGCCVDDNNWRITGLEALGHEDFVSCRKGLQHLSFDRALSRSIRHACSVVPERRDSDRSLLRKGTRRLSGSRRGRAGRKLITVVPECWRKMAPRGGSGSQDRIIIEGRIPQICVDRGKNEYRIIQQGNSSLDSGDADIVDSRRPQIPDLCSRHGTEFSGPWEGAR